tara:strand:+ start:485 stop:1666 length:1182 start_codon:yes stop_codon:yes gene_type:complete
MGNLKPIGSEKLTGDDKIKRIMEIARFGETTKNDDYHVSTNSFNKKGADGNTYSIVKEFDGYYLKCGINESEVDYISGFMNKKRDRFRSYGSALKRMNLIFKPLNEEFNGGKAISMYEQYTEVVTNETTEDEMDEQEKFVLNVPDEEGGEEEMDMEIGGDMEDEEMDMDMEDDMEDEEMDVDMDAEEGEEAEMEGFMKPIQKLTGKLGQKLRDVEEELGSADIKYVINSIISAVELENLDEEDLEDILGRFEDDEADYGDEEEVEDIDMGDDEEGMEMGDEEGMEMGDEDVEVEDEEEIQMESLRKRVGNLLESYVEKKTIKTNPKQYINSRVKKIQEKQNIKKYYSSVEQELSCEKFLKENKSFKFKRKMRKGIILEGRNKKVWVLNNGSIK